MYVPVESQKKEAWRKKFPAVVGALLSVFQMILTLVIVGCEVGGIFVQFPRMNVFVGFWTLPSFTCAWISLAGASCCCRIRCCGIATLVFQCMAIPMALCVVGFCAYFLNYPTLCFFSSDCSSYTYSYYSSTNWYGLSSNTTLYSIKVPLIKGQLAAGALMFVTCVAYIIIFAITNYGVHKAIAFQSDPPMPVTITYPPPPYTAEYANPIHSQPVGGIPVMQSPAILPAEPSISSPAAKHQLICPNCRSRFQVSA